MPFISYKIPIIESQISILGVDNICRFTHSAGGPSRAQATSDLRYKTQGRTERRRTRDAEQGREEVLVEAARKRV